MAGPLKSGQNLESAGDERVEDPAIGRRRSAVPKRVVAIGYKNLRLKGRARKATLVGRLLKVGVVEASLQTANDNFAETFDPAVRGANRQLHRTAIGRKWPEKDGDHGSGARAALESHAGAPADTAVRFDEHVEKRAGSGRQPLKRGQDRSRTLRRRNDGSGQNKSRKDDGRPIEEHHGRSIGINHPARNNLGQLQPYAVYPARFHRTRLRRRGGESMSASEAACGRESMGGMGQDQLLSGAGNRLDTEIDHRMPINRRFVGTPRANVRTSE